MPYTWSAEMTTGIARMDEQHKRLLASLNGLFTACARGQEYADISLALDLFLGYLCRHFHDEEYMQVQYDYPEYARHKALHEAFADTVHALCEELEHEGPDSFMRRKAHICLGDWLVNHITTEDRKLAEYVCIVADDVTPREQSLA